MRPKFRPSFLRALPSRVAAGLLAGAVALAGPAASARAAAAEAWGYNYYGELGNGTTTNGATPVAVTGLGSGVTAVAGGYAHSLAVQNGGVVAWGYNTQGQLGNGTFTSSTTRRSPRSTPTATASTPLRS